MGVGGVDFAVVLARRRSIEKGKKERREARRVLGGAALKRSA